MESMLEGARYRDIRMLQYLDETDSAQGLQLAAMTFLLPDDSAYVAFRGTDSTVVGWKEDFYFSFLPETEGQRRAIRYLNQVGAEVKGTLRVGGHSKGGNLAVYAGMMCLPATRARLATCFSHDGPGFSAQTMADPRWQHTARLIDKTIPQSSVIGMIFENQASALTVVRSTNPGIMQHSPFSWVVDGPDFAVEKAVSYDAYRTNKRVSAWLRTMTPEQLGTFVEVLYKLVQATGEGPSKKQAEASAARDAVAVLAAQPTESASA
jgi:hypothetical protein